jgi:hypothetical protein
MKRMYKILYLVSVFCFSSFFLLAEEKTDPSAIIDQSADVTAIREIMKKSIEGLNTHDIEMHLSTITMEYNVWSGRKKHQDREESLKKYWQIQKNVNYRLVKENTINFITPEVTVYNARFESSGQVDKDGATIPTDEWQGVWILTKKDGKWLISAWFSRSVSN